MGIKDNTISGYESGKSEPTQNALFQMADIFQISINDLFPSTMEPNSSYKKPMPITEEEVEMVKKYRALTEENKTTIDTLLNSLYDRQVDEANEDIS